MKKGILKNKINRFYRTLATVDVKYDRCVISTEDLNNTDILSEILYDIEDNFFTFEGIKELHRQVLKHMHKLETRHNICRKIAVAMGFAGIFLAAGVAGSDDLSRITFQQAIIGGGISTVLMGISFILYIKGEN